MFRGDNMLFFGRDCSVDDYQREMEHFHAFVRRVAHFKINHTASYRRYLLKPSRESYWLLYSLRELLELGVREAVGWAWRKLNRTSTHKIQQLE